MYFEIVLSHSRCTDSFIAASVIYSFTVVVVVVFNAVAIAVAVVAINGKGKELCFSTEVIKREKLGVCTQPH